jgi:hypothetical protein
VKLVDANLLLYAINRDSAHHRRARAWIERALADDEPVALAWIVLLAFLRLSTSARVFPEPLSAEQALAVVDEWLAQPAVVTIAPGPEHWRILRELLTATGIAGNLTTDAHLAALAIENGAVLHSSDADFGRFSGLRWENPLED